MTEPDDPDVTTRNRGESPAGALISTVRRGAAATACRGESPDVMTGPAPGDPDEELTHNRGESPWTARAFVGLNKPQEPVTGSRGGVLSMSAMRAPSRATEPTWPNPETKDRGEDSRGVLSTVPSPYPHPGPSPKRTNGRGESASAVTEPLEPRTADRGESPDGVAGSARRPRPMPNPKRTFDRGEAVVVCVDGQLRVAVDNPLTLLGLLAARQAGRG